MRAWQLIDTVIEVDRSSGHKLCGAALDVGKMALPFRQGDNAVCPSFTSRKAYWVASCACAKHKLDGDVIGLLDGCCHGNPLSSHPRVRARPPSRGPAIASPAYNFSESYRSARLVLVLLLWSRGNPAAALALCLLEGQRKDQPGHLPT